MSLKEKSKKLSKLLGKIHTHPCFLVLESENSVILDILKIASPRVRTLLQTNI